MSNLQAEEYKSFEEIKKIREDGTEYWNARELSVVLQYKKWENFSKVIDRAKLACQNSGRNIDDDFPEVRKIVEAGATQKKVTDYELSRYACYLIVQNGDPRKEVIGGTMPEDLPRPEKSIKQIEKEQLKRLKDKRTKLMLDE